MFISKYNHKIVILYISTFAFYEAHFSSELCLAEHNDNSCQNR